MTDERRTVLLMEYLDRLTILENGGVHLKKEIYNCLTEIERELGVKDWNSAREYSIASGTEIRIDTGYEGETIRIDGKAKLILLPM